METYEVQPVGSSRTHRVNIRLLAATNRDLHAMVRSGQFRDDLYYRLNGTSILTVPLRERLDDLDILAAHLIDQYNHRLGKEVRFISRAALVLLGRHADGR